jgi:hypothetical protein
MIKCDDTKHMQRRYVNMYYIHFPQSIMEILHCKMQCSSEGEDIFFLYFYFLKGESRSFSYVK